MPVNAVPFHEKEYWQNRFENENHFEWLLSWSTLDVVVRQYLNPHEPILHLGCGNSNLAFDLADSGYTHVVNVDYVEAVIDHMKEKTREKLNAAYDQIEWYTGDCLDDLSFLLERSPKREGFSVVLDKSLCDTIACGDDNHQTGQQTLAQRVMEITRPQGVWITVSFSSERQYIWPSDSQWTWQHEDAVPINVPQENDKPNAPAIYYYLYIRRKVPTKVLTESHA
ncbi:hypothetical protein EC973_005426 [Apophysomyces ossiformis]|uniref:Methyltransferase domain-containing protein n=1 Tax=Apophysomyces ossiformis TaxID=679940 RepID=A0A8H7BP91_9FUNG|nr:hypothetical protein EC973_005426 [Apophysomyces ossiformis]